MLFRAGKYVINVANVTYVDTDPSHPPEHLKDENLEVLIEVTFASPAVAPVQGTTSDRLWLTDEAAEEMVAYLRDHSDTLAIA